MRDKLLNTLRRELREMIAHRQLEEQIKKGQDPYYIKDTVRFRATLNRN